MSSRIVSGITLFLLLLSMSTLAVQLVRSAPTTITVPDDYLTIQEAINNANDGDTVFVRNGTYYEDIVVNKSLLLVGEDESNTFIDGNGTGVAVRVVADNVYLSGFTIRNGGTYPYRPYAVLFDDSSNITFTRNVVTSNKGHGMCLLSSSRVTIILNNISNNVYSAIHMEQCYDNIITENILTNSSEGIDVSFGSHHNIIKENVINNTINPSNNTYGVYVYQSPYNIFKGNTITNNVKGVAMGYSNNNIFHHNNFLYNIIQVSIFMECENTTWDNSYPSGGNYWSDYNGTDVYGGPYQNETGSDGIGDRPYVIDANNTDCYPLMHPWSSLPVHNIDTGLGYSAIQEAIDANETLDGDTIFVEAGTYYEHVVISKNDLSFIGEERDTTIIDGNVTGTVVYVTAENITFSGFTIQKSGGGDLTVGMFLNRSDGSSVYRNNMKTNYFGILLLDSTGCSISDNDVYCNSFGIALSNASSCSLSGNNVSSNNFGIQLSASSSSSISNNLVNSNNNDGIYLRGSSNCSLSGNTVINNGQLTSWHGIKMRESSHNTIYHNNFIDNANQVYLEGSLNNTWDDGYPSGGNYWSDYNGTDADGNGIGDTPYIIDQNNIDSYPLMNRYWNPCDINHDLKVDMRDVGISAWAYGTEPGDTRWNPHADITGPIPLEPDDKVDMRDIGLIASNFGETYP